MSIKLKIVPDCTEEEMAVILAAIHAYDKTGTDGIIGQETGWRFAGLANCTPMGFFDQHSLRNSSLSAWRKVGLYRWG